MSTDLRTVVADSLRYGYFHSGLNLWARCQHCRQDIHADWAAGTSDPKKATNALKDALLIHLREAAQEAAQV